MTCDQVPRDIIKGIKKRKSIVFMATVKSITRVKKIQIMTTICFEESHLLIGKFVQRNIFFPSALFSLDNFRFWLCYNCSMTDEQTPLLEPSPEEQNAENTAKANGKLWIIILVAALVLGLIVTAIVFLSKADLDTTSHIRDIFIIFMAFESIVIGVALVVLVVQISTLINLLQNEVKPILKSTKETVDTLKGTTEFLSTNLVEPVIKLNGYLAGLKQLFDIFKFKK